MWNLSGEDFTLKLTFKDRLGVAVLPDTGSVRLTVRDHAGVALTSFDNLLLVVTGNQYELTIPGSDNTLGVGNQLENRHIRVTYLVNGQAMQIKDSYKLCQFLPFAVVENDVRALLGLTYEELPDTDIDLYSAYFTLDDYLTTVKLTTTPLKDYLVAGTVKSIKANQLVAVQAAIDILPSIPQRIADTQKTENAEFTRNQKVDPYSLSKQLEGMKADLTNALLTVDPNAFTTPTIFAVSTPTDPITG